MESIFQTFFAQIAQWVMLFLPMSPFQYFVDQIGVIPYLDNLNWFFPVSEAIVLLETWLAVLAVYFTYTMILRAIRLIG